LNIFESIRTASNAPLRGTKNNRDVKNEFREKYENDHCESLFQDMKKNMYEKDKRARSIFSFGTEKNIK